MVQESVSAKCAREERVYRRHAPTVLAYLLRHISIRQDAEDLLIEVFLVILEKPAVLDLDEKRLASYVQAVARNKMADYYRKHSKKQIVPLETIAETVYETEERTPEQRVLAGEQLTDLRRAFDDLPEQQQTLLRLRFIHGLRSSEIAAYLAKSENSVRVMLSRSLKFLRKHDSLSEERD